MLRQRSAWWIVWARPQGFVRTHTSSAQPFVMSAFDRYGDWSRNQLLHRIAQLEAAAATKATPPPEPMQPFSEPGAKRRSKELRPIDVSAQPCRKIALRFCYDGSHFSGLAAQLQQTPLPTVEETLWEALCTSRLVDVHKGMEGAGWSRCGRTDAGVSAAGQVVALWVRSRRVDERALRTHYEQTRRDPQACEEDAPEAIHLASGDELPYVTTLNRLLPPSIRVQAWSPVTPSFSARFDCVYRHYKYFFTAGAPSSLIWQPESGSHFPHRLDVDRMREAAARLLGEHDFRNLCKVDPSKQITNFVRRIDGASIDQVAVGWPTTEVAQDYLPSTPTAEPMYVLNLRGSAFLYHQVRNIMAVLLMIGAHLEAPSLIDELLNVRTGAAAAGRLETLAKWEAGPEETHDRRLLRSLPTPSDDLRVYETKPTYEMGADRPLVLWECGFRPGRLAWRACPTDDLAAVSEDQVDYTTSLRVASQLHVQWTRQAIQTEIVRHFALSSACTAKTVIPLTSTFDQARSPCLPAQPDKEQPPLRAALIPMGNGTIRATTRYIPMHARTRDVSAEIKNQRWRDGKAKRRAERRVAEGGGLSDSPG